MAGALSLGGWGHEIALGALMTIALALSCLPPGLFLGLAVALAKSSSAKGLKLLGEAYTTIFRGIPELLTLLLIYYGTQILFQNLAAATGLPLEIDIPPFLAGTIALSLVFGAYASEVLLAALKAIEHGQRDAADSFGMPPLLAFRRVILPQLLRIALPGLGNNWVALLKDTSLVSVIALEDLLRKTQLAVGTTHEPFKFFGIACLLYLLMTAASALFLAWAERRAFRGWKPAR